MTVTISVLVIADISCPGCYIGQKRLHEGIAQFRESLGVSGGGTTGSTSTVNETDVQFDIAWIAHQIDPKIAMEGELFDSYCQRRWGQSQWTNADRIRTFCATIDGCDIANWKYVPNSLRAHQLVRYGIKYHRSSCNTDTMYAALFHAVYEEGQNISNVDTLVALGSQLFGRSSNESESDTTTTTTVAANVNVNVNVNVNTTTTPFNADHLRTYLQEHQGRNELLAELHRTREKYFCAMRGVPAFLIGKQPPQNTSTTTTTTTTNDYYDDVDNWFGPTRPPFVAFSSIEPVQRFVDEFRKLVR